MDKNTGKIWLCSICENGHPGIVFSSTNALTEEMAKWNMKIYYIKSTIIPRLLKEDGDHVFLKSLAMSRTKLHREGKNFRNKWLKQIQVKILHDEPASRHYEQVVKNTKGVSEDIQTNSQCTEKDRARFNNAYNNFLRKFKKEKRNENKS